MGARIRRAPQPSEPTLSVGVTSDARDALLQELACAHGPAVQLYEAGRYAEAALALTAICERSEALGWDDPFHLDRVAELAAFCHLAGAYDDAHTLYAELVAQRRVGRARDANFARLLGNYAELCRETDRIAEAAALVREALEIFRATIGPRHPEYASTLEKLARVFRQTGQSAEAAPLLREALRIKRAVPDIGPQPMSTVLSALAAVQYDLGRYPQALRSIEESLRYARVAFCDGHPEVATTVGSQAAIFFAMGDMPRAQEAAAEALRQFRAALGDRHPDTANAMNTLARILHLRGVPGEAEPLYLEALEAYHGAGAGERSAARAVLNHLAQLRILQGRHFEAEAIYDEIIRAEERDGGPHAPGLAILLNNRAQLALVTGDYGRARVLYERALAISRRTVGVSHPDYASILSNLGALHHDVGDTGRALRLTRRALAVERRVLGERHPDVALTLSKLGALHAERRKFGQAAAAYGEALDIHRAAGAASGSNAALVLNNLAVLHIEMGDYARAEELNRRALSLRRACLGGRHPDVGESLINLATAEHDQGRFARSAALARQALRVLEPAMGPTHPRVVRCRHSIAVSLAALGRPAAALRMAVQAEEAFDRTLHSVIAAASERQRMGYLERLQRQHDTFLSLALMPRQGRAGARAAADVVLRRKGITAEVLAAQRAGARVGEDGLPAEMQRLTELRLRIARKTLDGPGMESPAAHRRMLASWEEAREQLETELAARLPELRLEQELRAAGRAAVAGALPPRAVLVELTQYSPVRFDARAARGEALLDPPRYVALVMHAGAPDGITAVDLGPTARIDALMMRFRAARRGERELSSAQDGAGGIGMEPTGRRLRAAVLDPLLPALQGRTRLFMAPDGALALLPWEALPWAEGTRVIDHFRVTYLTTGRDLLRLAAPRLRVPGPAVVLAAPNYDLAPMDETPAGDAGAVDVKGAGNEAGNAPPGRASRDLRRTGLRFAPLPATADEGRRVAELLDVAPLLGSFALKARVRDIRSPGVLHVATHGFFLPDHRPRRGAAAVADPAARLSRAKNPLLRSGLALAGANRWLHGLPLPPEAEDGLLTAEDVTALDLHATELVVLSACETGMGSARAGEGVFGLRRAFVVAGVRTLVISLWSIPDAQTRELMEHFYRLLREGAPRADALREAQLAVRERHPDPWFWGAFICQGDPGPLPAALLPPQGN